MLGWLRLLIWLEEIESLEGDAMLLCGKEIEECGDELGSRKVAVPLGLMELDRRLDKGIE